MNTLFPEIKDTSFTTVKITKFNSVYIKIECSHSVGQELSDHFSFQPPGFKFTPAFKNRMWDGFIRLYSLKTRMIYAGLHSYIVKFCADSGYVCDDQSGLSTEVPTPISKDQIEGYIRNVLKPSSGGVPIEIRDYQLDAIIHAIRTKRCVVESPTSSGKSLLIYSIVRYLIASGDVNRVLIIFPSISLVNQMCSDFEDYSSTNGWKTEKYCHKVFSGQDKDDLSKKIIFSTYQSIYQLPPAYFNNFNMVVSDESHLIVGKSLTGCFEKCHNIDYRYGFSGSLQAAKAHRLVIEGVTGKAYTTTTTSELMQNKQVAQLKIKCLLLNYPESTRKIFKGTEYAEEMKYLCSYTKRNEFITKLAGSLEGNTLLLFTYISHGKILVDMLKAMGKKNVYFIHGSIKPEIRESIRKIIEESEDAIIVASYGVFATGINCKRLNNLILGSPYKSKIKILQSTGRVLRLAKDKTDCVMYDVADDISYKSSQNHTLKHFASRVELYAEQKFDYTIIDCPIK